ncbi:glycoside hydrolase family 25 protein [Bacteroides sp. 224]|uniref:glycoside hydrolase family 25 protein n=1 Tax=Bacteroides sp. 224 TaxID=2302936 RepID=UPI0013D3BCD2|nr:glycoside hydrolase family 25 protein [Bacteroides sp. 224]NDV64625.1 glycoside hydrolase family 25 protein [Bacteroides sp. 224]
MPPRKAIKSRKKPALSSRRTNTTRKRKKKTAARDMPNWVRNIIAVTIVFLFISVFYYFFIRPYSYRWKPCRGQKAYGVCMPYGYLVHGIDISHYQGEVDWAQLDTNQSAAHPIRFAFMKATEGGDLCDSTFHRNFDMARRQGLIRGAYHFYIPKTDALKQANFFIRTVQLKNGDLPPVLDVEITGNKSKEELQEGVKLWLKEVETHYGVKPIIYASYKFKMKYLNDSLFNTYPYWIAHYYVDSVHYEGKWNFWQHSDVGRVPGIKEAVDLNVFNGTLKELQGLTISASGRRPGLEKQNK